MLQCDTAQPCSIEGSAGRYWGAGDQLVAPVLLGRGGGGQWATPVVLEPSGLHSGSSGDHVVRGIEPGMARARHMPCLTTSMS